MGGFSGFTLAAYDATPDWWLAHSYFADFDDEHKLIPLRKRCGWVEVDDEGQDVEVPEEQAEATPESLGIPLECFLVEGGERPSYVSWIMTYFRVWRSRGKSPEWITERWRQDRQEQAEYVEQVYEAAARLRDGQGKRSNRSPEPEADPGGGAPARLR